LGRWLTVEQVGQLLAAPDLNTIKGLCDHAVLVFLIGAGLRRSEIAALDCTHIQQRDGRWLAADLIGKHGRIRTVPLPVWAHLAMREWVTAADISEGPLFRSVTRYGHVAGRRLSAQAIFTIVTGYAATLGIALGPHDLRRTFAKLARLGQSPLEQIQFSLGHASVVTTEVYLGNKQDLQDAPCDHLGLEVIDSRRKAPTV
jgi:site-specific recombinase XerD